MHAIHFLPVLFVCFYFGKVDKSRLSRLLCGLRPNAAQISREQVQTLTNNTIVLSYDSPFLSHLGIHIRMYSLAVFANAS